jgi:hypothetical protein
VRLSGEPVFFFKEARSELGDHVVQAFADFTYLGSTDVFDTQAFSKAIDFAGGYTVYPYFLNYLNEGLFTPPFLGNEKRLSIEAWKIVDPIRL